MRDQQISPWTFLNERMEIDKQNSLKPGPKSNKFTLPKVNRTRESLSQQQETSSLAKNKIKSNSYNTMILSLQYDRPLPSSSVPIKKKTEADIDQPFHLYQKAETISCLNEVKVIAKLIHFSLAEQQKSKQARRKLTNKYVNSLHSIQYNTSHNTSVKTTPSEIIHAPRIHQKLPQFNLSVLRSILKRERGELHVLNTKIQSKKNRQIQNLKLKLTDKYNNNR